MATHAADTIADLLRRGIAVRFTATGDSMDPLIRSNDLLLVEPVRAEEVARGEVVLSRTARGLTAHRVVGVWPEPEGVRLVTRGDNAPADDAAFSAAELLGRVTHVERGGRTWPVRRLSGPTLALARLAVRAVSFAARRLRLR